MSIRCPSLRIFFLKIFSGVRDTDSDRRPLILLAFDLHIAVAHRFDTFHDVAQSDVGALPRHRCLSIEALAVVPDDDPVTVALFPHLYLDQSVFSDSHTMPDSILHQRLDGERRYPEIIILDIIDDGDRRKPDLFYVLIYPGV